MYVISFSIVADADEYRQHGTHQHGLAQINLAIEEKDVHIALISPAANIVGFEHEPHTPEQEAAIKQALQTLEDGSSLFGLSSKADCQLVEAQVTTDIMSETDHEHNEEQSGEPHEHEHDHDGHDETEKHSEEHHEHEHHEHNAHDDDAEHGHEGHSEFEMTYHFVCKKAKKLWEIEVNLFSVFPGMERIQVHALTDSGQLSVELNPKQTRIKL
jgi:hypothetical protein